MTTKADFNAQEWETITSAPAMAATVVATADKGGTLREGISMAKAYQAARGENQGGLLGDLLTSQISIELVSGNAVGLRERGLAAVRAASDLLREKGTEEELREFGDFVLAVCDRVARAHQEGGVLGIGGMEVSVPEQAALNDVAAALGERPGRAPAA